MMLLLTLVSMAAVVCCPPTLPIWVFMLVGFHLSLRPQRRRDYLHRHGQPPAVGTLDWFLLNC